MKLKENNSAQKLRGAYYTPLPLAEMMVKLFLRDESIKTVLEPSCGDGVFIDALDDMKMLEQLNDATAIEIEQDEVEKLKHRSKEISVGSDIFQKKNINYQNVDEVKKENEYLIKKIEVKNNDFQNLYDFVMEIISNNEPYIKEFQNNVNELNSFKKNELKSSNSYNKNISKEIIHMKNDYEKLKIKYNELLEKMKIEDKEESKKQKVKFISKDKSQKTKEEYETKIKKLKEDNQKLKNDYKQQLEEVKNELSDIKLKNSNKEKELELLSEKYENIIKSLNEKLNEKKSNLK